MQESPPPPRPAAPGTGPEVTRPPRPAAAGPGQAAGPGGASEPGGAGEPGEVAEPLPTSARWRVDGRLVGLKATGLVIFVLAALVLLLASGDRLGGSLSVVAAVALAGYLVRDVAAPVRLAADPDGLTVVAGFIGRRRLAWSQVEQMRVERRRHLGLRNEFLEIDTSDSLHLFSSYDLGEPPDQALRTLLAIRQQSGVSPAAPPSSSG
ncbi:MAG: PH domain-containing protein [Micromonosporaceae bacterium]|nr:PH domain-containing protein [Micromonosporaceae bacterium]